MAQADPGEVPDLPVGFMNADHALEARLIDDIERALAAHARGQGTLEDVLQKLSVLAVRTRDHFLREESLMRETGFLAYAAHKAEHDGALARMNAEAGAFRASGDARRLSRYLSETLPKWFGAHVRVMDAATAGSGGVARRQG